MASALVISDVQEEPPFMHPSTNNPTCQSYEEALQLRFQSECSAGGEAYKLVMDKDCGLSDKEKETFMRDMRYLATEPLRMPGMDNSVRVRDLQLKMHLNCSTRREVGIGFVTVHTTDTGERGWLTGTIECDFRPDQHAGLTVQRALCHGTATSKPSMTKGSFVPDNGTNATVRGDDSRHEPSHTTSESSKSFQEARDTDTMNVITPSNYTLRKNGTKTNKTDVEGEWEIVEE